MDILVEAEDILTRWAEVATAAWQEDRDIAAALDEAFAPDLAGLDDEAREIMDPLNGVHSNAAGFQRLLHKRANPRPSPANTPRPRAPRPPLPRPSPPQHR